MLLRLLNVNTVRIPNASDSEGAPRQSYNRGEGVAVHRFGHVICRRAGEAFDAPKAVDDISRGHSSAGNTS